MIHKLLTGVFCLFLTSFAAWGQAGGGAGGSGGGGGGSNLYTFRYIFLSQKKVQPKTFVNDKSLDRAYAIVQSVKKSRGAKVRSRYYYGALEYEALYFFDNVINSILLGSLKITRMDRIDRHKHKAIPKKPTKISYFLMASQSDPGKSDTTYILSAPGSGDTVMIESHRILYEQIIPYHRLSFFILGRNQDTLMFEIWPRPRKLQNRNFDAQSTVIEGIRNGELYNHQYKNQNVTADTFYAVIPWRNQGVGPRFQTFNLMFATHYLIPITIPIGYTFVPKAWQSNFLNAGMAYGWAIGRTKFYRDALQPPRNFYWGAGFLAGVSSVSLSSSSVKAGFNVGSGYSLPGVYTGMHVGLSFNSVQFMLTGTYEWAIGSNSSQWIYQHRFSLGIAIGLSSFNLAVPNSSSAALAH